MKVNYKKIVFIILISFSIAILFYFIKNQFNIISPNYISINNNNSFSFNKNNNKVNFIKLLNSDEAKDFFNKGDALFIDARDPWDYSEKHIYNSINLPEFNFNPNNPLLKFLDKNGIYITYCSANECDLSKKLATKLKNLGFKNVYVYTDGIEKWTELRLPIFKK